MTYQMMKNKWENICKIYILKDSTQNDVHNSVWHIDSYLKDMILKIKMYKVTNNFHTYNICLNYAVAQFKWRK